MMSVAPRSIADLHTANHDSGNLLLPIPLTAFGLPSRVCARYADAQVTELFSWQAECLLADNGQVLRGERNLVYSAPTSGGKVFE